MTLRTTAHLLMNTKINFTKALLDNLPLPAPGDRPAYRDAKVQGLQLRVTANGVKSFSFLRRVKGGAPVREHIGKYPGMTIEGARRKAAELNALIEAGSNPGEARRALNAEPTLDDLFERYFKDYSSRHNASAQQDKRRYEIHLKPKLGKKKLSAIDRQAIASIHRDITDAGHSTQANRVLALVSTMFSKAISWDLASKNPAEGVDRNKEQSRDRFLQPAEITRFFEALWEEENEIVRDFFLVALMTGARRSNVLAMRWGDVDLEQRLWRLETTKNGTPQNVVLAPDVVDLLKARREHAPDDQVFVFPGSGKTGHLVEPKKGWQRVLERSNIENLRIHDLRRTLGSWLARQGTSLLVIGKSLNHKSSQATAVYARLDTDPVRVAVESAIESMMKAGGRKPEPASG